MRATVFQACLGFFLLPLAACSPYNEAPPSAAPAALESASTSSLSEAPAPIAESQETSIESDSSRKMSSAPDQVHPTAAPLNVAKAPPEAKVTKSGLAYQVIRSTTKKDHATSDDAVVVHYAGWTKNGKLFDSSIGRGAPAIFQIRTVVKGLSEGLQLMSPGEKRRFWLPAHLAYGEKPQNDGAPAGQLTFDVELHEIIRGPQAPKDIAKAPRDAVCFASGVCMKRLAAGSSPEKKADISSAVVVHYSGWMKNGHRFDTSAFQMQPVKFKLNQVIEGWKEAIVQMPLGSKYLIWVPAEFAYGDPVTKPGAPPGDLTFEIELLDIIDE